jgi:L1 cell adhesion molecule like protein
LEQYAYQIKNTLKDEKLKDKFSEDEKKQIEAKVDEVLKWTNDNPAASKEEYDAKVKEIEAVFNPIMQKIYQQAGGAPGGMPNFGGANPGAGAPGTGPSPGSKGTATGGAEDVE